MKHKYIIFLSALLIGLSSCGEDFLYKSPQGSVDEEALTNEQGVELLVINAYGLLNDDIGWGATPFNWTFGGIYGGDANKGSDSNDQAPLNALETYSITASNEYLRHKWQFAYWGAKRCNLALHVMSNAEDMSEDLKTLREGELRFLRALYYFEGVKVFGSTSMPFIDEALSSEENDPKVHNGTDIYPNIIADINFAIDALPEKAPEDVGRASHTAALALKAKILMQMGNMAEAKPILEKIINTGISPKGEKLRLQDDMNYNFSALTENGAESIFEVQFSLGANNNGNYGLGLAYPHNSGPGGCCGFYQPSFELVNSYQVDENGLPYLDNEYRSKKSVTEKVDGYTYISRNDKTIAVDPRLDFAVGRYEIPYKDWGLPENDWVRDSNNGGVFLPKKHVYSKEEEDMGLGNRSNTGGWAPGSAMNLQYLCLRDVMLLYAECLANDNELAAAMEQVNKIRARAAKPENIIYLEDGTPAANYLVKEYPSTHAAFTNKDVCIKAIRMERKLELAMEGQRFFDLVRWGGDYMNKELAAYLEYEKNYIYKFVGVTPPSAARTMLPIPETEIQTLGRDESGNPYLVQPEPWR
ncbi:MAG: RagB/SusD family nutrient uptake outer membrane protein [Tannerellaceae bacterium]|nr:RagB/SusD family nutrient uptake outer membrane protein [Tannerellaceae bacterium]